jgi:hypothetical protein
MSVEVKYYDIKERERGNLMSEPGEEPVEEAKDQSTLDGNSQ